MPQSWRALCYDIEADRLAPRTLPASADAIVRKGADPKRIAIVVASRDEASVAVKSVPGLKGLRPRTKDPRKGLSIYVPARGALAVHVSAPYRHPGQTERGIRALAGSPAGKRWPGVYLLEIDAKLFGELWARAWFAMSAGSEERVSSESEEALGMSSGPADFDAEGEDVAIPESLSQSFVGASLEAEEVRRRIVMASLTGHPVLIMGETGTGKEIVARQIHQLGRRCHASFITVNCAAIAHDLLESELFGHLKGAFTGATSNKKGLYEMAQDGTLFLDEVGDLHAAHQAKVLRMLNDGDYRRVGSHKRRKGNARIIAATNRNLPQMVEAGTFRDDLYYRLLSFVIETPALRSHPDDIPMIAAFLWPRVTEGTACDAKLSRTVVDMLKDYPWQGNVRELRAFLANLSTLAGPRPLTPSLVSKAFLAWTRIKTRGEDR
ncbi:MAG: sigma 54-interacting transcriptional regulator [Acidobacteria bacterium]|nr:sigma 54-interacting transcriptional regulator [Acidobacteriota bacterium]